jgi:hypothetical protein
MSINKFHDLDKRKLKKKILKLIKIIFYFQKFQNEVFFKLLSSQKLSYSHSLGLKITQYYSTSP